MTSPASPSSEPPRASPEQTGGWRSVLRHDLPASIVVFLVALPLCLGIAVASGAPPMAGLVTGIIGGILVGRLSGSHVAVSGPAAGLTVVVLEGLETLGSFEALLLAVAVAGVLQLVLGLLRGGELVHYFPASVIRGMLAGIGLIIIFTQLPHMLGLTRVSEELGLGSLHLLAQAEAWPLVLGLSSLGVLVLAERWEPLRRRRYLPGPLLAVGGCLALDALVGLFAPSLSLAPALRVSVPNVWEQAGVASLVRLPDFGVVWNPTVLWVGLVIAVVASIETLLCIEGVDRIDTLRRRTPPNRELIAQGVGNTLCGLVGGLPMTAVIVRGSANVQAGARSRWSAMLHGVMLLAAVLLVPALLNRIPMAALGAVLVHVGYKLASPKVVRAQLRQPWPQLLPFVLTVVCIPPLGLLQGVTIGLVASLAFCIQHGFRAPISIRHGEQGHVRLAMSSRVSFFHKPRLRRALQQVPAGARVEIDASGAQHVDHEVVDAIEEFADSAPQRGVELEVRGLARVGNR